MTHATWWVFGVALVWLSAHAVGLLGPLEAPHLPVPQHRLAFVAIVVGVA